MRGETYKRKYLKHSSIFPVCSSGIFMTMFARSIFYLPSRWYDGGESITSSEVCDLLKILSVALWLRGSIPSLLCEYAMCVHVCNF